MVRYSYPRAGAQVEGASVYLAREAARVWGNIRYGFDIVHDDDEIRTVRAWAWDLESNTRRQIDATFKKLIYRRKGGWQAPDERDLRELTNKQGETAVRNCLLHLLPPDLVDDALEDSLKTLSSDAAKDPMEARKKLVLAFRGLGITALQLEQYLGHQLALITPDEIANLRGVWKSIADGNSKWPEYVQTEDASGTGAKTEASGVTMDDLISSQQPPPQPATESKPEPQAEPPQSEPDTDVEKEWTQADFDKEEVRLVTALKTATARMIQSIITGLDSNPLLTGEARQRLSKLCQQKLAGAKRPGAKPQKGEEMF